jgi:hydrogenase maturation protein HypF
MKIRRKIIIYGIVQGVGFRPYIHKLVQKYHLAGWVCNSNQGVEMEIEGKEGNINFFLENFKDNLPPLAIVEDIEVKELPWLGYTNFKIKESNNNYEQPIILMPPDVSVCEDCLRELNNPADRRYRYPFINCTNCGPRFTIIEDMPYDRGKTTMKDFPMCPDCNTEYNDINNRRYHAQPNACPVCGPEVYLYEGNKKIVIKDPIKEAQSRLIKGQIGAIKGLGGFHLACDASNHSAVLRLREIKQRDEKPFAVMVENSDKVRIFCHLSEYARKYLESKEKPIVILKKKKGNCLSPEIAPGNGCVGVMLPYTPLHYLLLQKSSLALVMTSANFCDEPIIIQNEEAFQKLAHQVDFLLIHNRAIYNRCDDSVLKISYNRPIFIRRSRGYAPFPIVLPKNSKQVLAVGPEQKNTVCFTRDHYAFPSQHLGDLKNKDSFEAYQEAIKRLSRVFQFNPEMVACDLHPDYLSTSYAEEVSKEKELPLLRIQHHHAHIASCMAENYLTEKVIGIAFDGTGLGEDNHIWGGEFLVANLKDYCRVGHFKYQAMPGGEQAISQPWRMAYSYLYSIFGKKIVNSNLELIKRRTSKELYLLNQMIDKKINSPLTSSCGRLFDAVAALINLRDEVNFEGQAAVKLEAMCQSKYRDHYTYSIEEEKSKWIVNTEEMLLQIIHEMERHENTEKIATKFHNTIADLTLSMCVKMRNKYNINMVVLSGGVFQNSFLLNRTLGVLKKEDFKIYIHQKMPPNDACISLGQAVIANAKT